MRPLDKEQKEVFAEGFDKCMTKIISLQIRIDNAEREIRILQGYPSPDNESKTLKALKELGMKIDYQVRSVINTEKK